MLRQADAQASMTTTPENNDTHRDSLPVVYSDVNKESTLCTEDAWVVLNMLRWEAMQSLKPATTSSLKQLKNQLSSLPSFFKPKIKSELQKDPLHHFTQSFHISFAHEYYNVCRLTRDMLSQYCQDDNPQHPSVLFDAIIVGAYIYTAAMEDKMYGRKEEFNNKDLYPLTLDKIVADCKISPDYANTTIIGLDKSIVGQIMIQRLIWMIGYKSLIEKSLPFNGVLNKLFSPQLAKAFPPAWFEKYHLDGNAYAGYPEKQRVFSIQMIDAFQINLSPEKNFYPDQHFSLKYLRELAVSPQPATDFANKCLDAFPYSGMMLVSDICAIKPVDDAAFVAAHPAASSPTTAATTPMTATAAAAATTSTAGETPDSTEPSSAFSMRR